MPFFEFNSRANQLLKKFDEKSLRENVFVSEDNKKVENYHKLKYFV